MDVLRKVRFSDLRLAVCPQVVRTMLQSEQNPPHGKLTSNKVRRSRRGVAITEFAVCLPVVLLVVFGTLETCEMIQLKQSLTVAAYEGVRTALVPDVEDGSVEVVCQELLAERGVNDAIITITPTSVASAPVGTYVSVEIRAPIASNCLTGFVTPSGDDIMAHVEMMKEF